MTPKPTSKPAARPKKRPSQSRAKFTVQALYDSLVRIWKTEGPDAATTRAVAEEAGFAIGTLYEYFPNREALLSGYIRHATEAFVDIIKQENEALEDAPWHRRLHHLLNIATGHSDTRELPFFDRAMMQYEVDIAEAHHQRRAFEDLSAAWAAALMSWPDVPHPVTRDTANHTFAIVWGARRYMLLVGDGIDSMENWPQTLETACRALVESKQK